MPHRIVRTIVVAVAAAWLAACGEKTDDEIVAQAKDRLSKRDYAAASVELKNVLQRRPSDPVARLLLGKALLDQGDAKSAVVELEKAKAAGADAAMLVPALARAWLEAGRAKDVIREYGEVVISPPAAQADLRAVVAQAHLQLGRKTEALAALNEVFRQDANHPGGLLMQAKIAASEKRVDDALKLAERSMRTGASNGEAHMVRGVLLQVVKKDVAAARKEFEQAADDPRARLAARTALIQSFLSQHQMSEAKAELAALQKAFPKNLSVAYMAAVVAYSDKDYAKSDALSEALLRYAPDNPQVLTLGGAAALKHGELLRAEARLGKVVQTVDNAPLARKLLGETYVKQGQTEKALQTLLPLIEGGNKDGDALALAGQAHLLAGRLDRAEEAFSAAAKMRPEDMQVRTALALTDYARGRTDSAIEALQALAAKDPGDTADLALISSEMKRKDYVKALAAIDRLVQKQPRMAAPLHLRGQALRAKGDLVSARMAFEEALKRESQYFPAIADLALLDLQDRRPDAARERLKAAIKANPKNVSAHMALLELVSGQGASREERLGLIEDAIRANAGEPGPHVAKIATLSATGDIKGAANAAQVALAQIPSNATLLDAAGQALGAAGDSQQAITTYNKMMGVVPQSALPHLRLAELHRRRGDTSAARASLSRAFEVAPDSSEVQSRLLDFAARTKDYAQVLSAAKTLQKRAPESAGGYLLEGSAELTRRAWPAAIAAFRTALTKQPDAEGRSQRLLYSALRSSGDASGAERFAQTWVKSSPGDMRFREYLGLQALEQRRFDDARRWLREVVEKQPNNASAINNLAWAMAELGESGAAAMAQRSLTLMPGAAEFKDTLAKALASEGKIIDAIRIQRELLTQSDRSLRAVYRLHLAELYAQNAQAKEALHELDELGKGDALSPQLAAAATAVRRRLVAAK